METWALAAKLIRHAREIGLGKDDPEVLARLFEVRHPPGLGVVVGLGVGLGLGVGVGYPNPPFLSPPASIQVHAEQLEHRVAAT
jgi:hypothetical protein